MYALDDQGNLLWDIFIPNTPEEGNVRINSTFKFKGGYYFKDSHGIKEFDPNTGDYWEAPEFAKIGFTRKGYNYAQPCGVDQMIVLHGELDGSYTLQKYDSLTVAFYEKNIPEITDYFTEFIQSKDGGFISLTRDTTMLITKMDCLGNVDHWSVECQSKIPDNVELIIYPNPSEKEISIEATFDFNEVVLYSPNGQHISYANYCECGRQTIDISNLAAGVYIIRISSDEQFAVSKFVKI